jgi:ATP-dependent DNA helicase RecG
MRKMMFYGKKYGGEDPQLIEGDIFRTVIRVPEYGAKPAAKYDVVQVGLESGAESGEFKGQVTPQVTPQVTGEVTGEVSRLLVVIKGEMKRMAIQNALGLKHEDYFREAFLVPAMQKGLLEMTIPDKPRSSKQKYRLTDKGKRILAGLDKLP